MLSLRYLARSLRTCNREIFRKFSSTSCLLVEKRKVYYPNEKIKTMDDFQKYASDEEKSYLTMVQAEYVHLCKIGVRVPELTDEEWLTHMNYDSKKGRTHHLKALALKKEMVWRKKKAKIIKPSQSHDPTSFYKKLYWLSEEMVKENRVARAMALEDPIIIDLSYADKIYYNEIKEVARHLFITIGNVNASALSHNPTLNIVLCNATPSIEQNEIVKALRRLLSENYNLNRLPFTLTEKSYLDLFPKSDLVYLSSNAKEYYHPLDGIPIIPGMLINKTTKGRLSIQRASDEGMKARKLPIDLEDKLIQNWLPINLTIQYVAALRFTNDLEIASKTLPKRMFARNPAHKFRKEYSMDSYKY